MPFATERRQDLAVGLSRAVLGGNAKFLSPLIFPMFPVSEIGSKITAAKEILGEATKNRAAGTSLSGTRIETKEISYSCDSFEDRARITEREVKLLGGEANAQLSGARTSAYGVMKKVEAECVTIVFTADRYAAAYTSTSAAPLLGINLAANAVKRYGEPHLFCSEFWLAKFVANTAIATLLKDLYGNGVIQGLLGGEEKVLAAVGITFGVKAIHVGDDNFWNIDGKSDAAAVIAIRPEIASDVVTGVKTNPCYGFGPTFLPTDGTVDAPFSIETDWDSDAKDNLVDATQDLDMNEINASGAVLVKLPADTVPVVATPTFDTAAGEVIDNYLVVIACATPDTNIRYTTDGSTPSATVGTLYDQLGDGVAITDDMTVKAIAYRSGYVTSAVASAAYTVAT